MQRHYLRIQLNFPLIAEEIHELGEQGGIRAQTLQRPHTLPKEGTKVAKVAMLAENSFLQKKRPPRITS
ncbi:hypothetical protein L1887_25183 [Cichorium endivia]|nr:hypothetical protein L1887_25183 [Cichorium endivia]